MYQLEKAKQKIATSVLSTLMFRIPIYLPSCWLIPLRDLRQFSFHPGLSGKRKKVGMKGGNCLVAYCVRLYCEVHKIYSHNFTKATFRRICLFFITAIKWKDEFFSILRIFLWCNYELFCFVLFRWKTHFKMFMLT